MRRALGFDASPRQIRDKDGKPIKKQDTFLLKLYLLFQNQEQAKGVTEEDDTVNEEMLRQMVEDFKTAIHDGVMHLTNRTETEHTIRRS